VPEIRVSHAERMHLLHHIASRWRYVGRNVARREGRTQDNTESEAEHVLTSFADGTIFGERTGTNTPDVLGLHGWGRTHTDLRSVLDGHDSISLDLPGFGASPPPDRCWTTEDYAAALDPIIDTMNRPIVIVAHSFGGRVAVHVAARRPASVAGLVLCGVPLLHRHGRPSKPRFAFRLAKGLNQVGIFNDTKMDAVRDKYGSEDYRNSSGVMREVFVAAVNESYEAPMAKVSCPVELVWGDRDTAAPPEIAVRSETLLADAHLTVVGDVDHFLPLTHPGPMREALDRRRQAATR